MARYAYSGHGAGAKPASLPLLSPHSSSYLTPSSLLSLSPHASTSLSPTHSQRSLPRLLRSIAPSLVPTALPWSCELEPHFYRPCPVLHGQSPLLVPVVAVLTLPAPAPPLSSHHLDCSSFPPASSQHRIPASIEDNICLSTLCSQLTFIAVHRYIYCPHAHLN
ncbi:hypothetical protein M011DRAFT_55875 [Sporormia fimetaria CBS 119925]|uniref:Uncharacterized protein n=1 Tax=Sporormia fimetaria CBS 119925 TaxID=1340428 RepID=A0A6A6V9W7_9PLEO|nr:hypothetical protein M011DRAFT_55875 [Sporormia fimetaria CBS 119925]